MSKVPPKKIPAWIATFVAFAQEKERRSEGREALAAFPELLAKHWEAFQEKAGRDAQGGDRPKKRAKADPIQSLGKALTKVAERVDEVKNSPALLDEYRQRVQSVVPEQVRPVLGGGSSSGAADLQGILVQTTQDLGQLTAVTQRLLEYVSSSSSREVNQDAALTRQSLTQVVQDIGELRQSLQV